MNKVLICLVLIVTLLVRLDINGSSNICRVIFLDVGQGDSSLIQCGGKKVLIDAGPDDAILFKLGKYIMPWDKSVDLLIISHPHSDHYYGLFDLIGRYEFSEVWINDVGYSDAVKKMLKFDLKMNIIDVCSDARYEMEKVELSVISPPCKKSSQLQSLEKNNINNSSIVLYLKTFDGNNEAMSSIVFMGDAEKELENAVVADNNEVFEVVPSRKLIVKAGHHCSNTSSSGLFIKRLKPSIAICSVGSKNKYGHPGKSTISLFQELNIRYYLTNDTGDVLVNLLDVKAL